MGHKICQPKVVVRLVFAAVVLAWAIQFMLVKTLGAPYPAITMPEFRGSGGYQNGKVYVKRMEVVFVTKENEMLSFTQRELLSGFPESHHETIANCFLSPLADNCACDLAQGPCREIARTVFPGFRAGSLRRTAPENTESLRSWVFNRARQLLPGRAIERVEFRWYQDVFQDVSGRLLMERKPDGTLVIPLTE